MADVEIATKAPENDGAEQSVFPGDTPAQEGVTMGVRKPQAPQAALLRWASGAKLQTQDHCVTDRPTRKLPGAL